MKLEGFPRRRYTYGTTPIEKAERLSAALGGPTIYIKRDDRLGLAGGGSKTRKLEFLMADALSQNADTVITCGAVQSNHCRLTLAAAKKEGLACQLVLQERVPGSYNRGASGNNFLYKLLGVEKIKVISADADPMTEMQQLAQELAHAGRKAYLIPVGGSNPLGACGYVAAAREILSQLFDLCLPIDRLVVASGSGGTHSGLLTGLFATNSDISVVGINVSHNKYDQQQLVHTLANQTAEFLQLRKSIPEDRVYCYDDYVGPGYSLPTPEMAKAVRLLARTEGILIDPVYTGKAMAGLIDLSRKGVFSKNENILFIHTGGAPALYAYQQDVLESD